MQIMRYHLLGQVLTKRCLEARQKGYHTHSSSQKEALQEEIMGLITIIQLMMRISVQTNTRVPAVAKRSIGYLMKIQLSQ